MELTPSAVRGCRLRAHHLLSPLSPGALETAAGACGLQNSPPGSWELALFNRVADCSLAQLEEALCRRKTLLQAWSYRGAPVVFPTGDSGVFLSPLAALPGEEPWIYTQGLPLALDHLGMTFGELLPLVEQAARYLDHHAVHSKEELDRVLAKEAEPLLPREKLPLWRDGSMYGRPDRQTVGGAVVSFLLRPCSFRGLVVFGEREGGSPWFLSYRAWLNQQPPQPDAEGDRELVRRFLRCYGPATQRELAAWLGCTPAQAQRLWQGVAQELEPAAVGRKKGWILAGDWEKEAEEGSRLLLLGPHDPYLDLRDRSLVLEDPRLQRLVWRTVANPGAILEGGRIIGCWRGKTRGEQLELILTLWRQQEAARRERLQELGEALAAFRGLSLKKCLVETVE